jgi:hypothetical protein
VTITFNLWFSLQRNATSSFSYVSRSAGWIYGQSNIYSVKLFHPELRTSFFAGEKGCSCSAKSAASTFSPTCYFSSSLDNSDVASVSVRIIIHLVMLKCLPFVVLCKQFGQRKTY